MNHYFWDISSEFRLVISDKQLWNIKEINTYFCPRVSHHREIGNGNDGKFYGKMTHRTIVHEPSTHRLNVTVR